MHKEIKWSEDRERKKVNRAFKIARHRGLKNFLFWLLGFICCIVFIVGAAYLTLKLIPLKSLLGENNEYVSEEVAENSLFDTVFSFGNYKIKDFPILTTTIQNAVSDAGLDAFIEIDIDGVGEISFSAPDLMQKIGENIEVVATIESLGGVDILGDLGKISAFTDVELVPNENLPDETGTNFNAKLYYYYNSNGNLVRAFSNDHVRLEESKNKDLYYPALKDVKILEVVDIISERLGESTVVSLLTAFSDIENDNVLLNIIGDKKIKELGEISENSIYLYEIMDYSASKTLFDILMDVSKKTDYKEITLADVMSVADIENIKLSTVMPVPELGNNPTEAEKISAENVKKIYAILEDARPAGATGEITFKDLKNFNKDNIRLSTVITTNESGTTGNSIIDALIKDEENPVTIGNFAEKVNELSFFDVYPSEASCFSTDKNDSLCGCKYKKIGEDYYYVSEEDAVMGETYYYVKPNMMIYMLYKFDDGDEATFDITASGHAVRWIHKDIRIGDLSKFGNAEEKMGSSTIRMLIDTGIILDRESFKDKPSLYALTLDQFLELMDVYIGMMP